MLSREISSNFASLILSKGDLPILIKIPSSTDIQTIPAWITIHLS